MAIGSTAWRSIQRESLADAGPLEQALGLLGTLMLRNPAAAEAAVEASCVDSCVEAMRACEGDAFTDSATGTQWVARQVCLITCVKYEGHSAPL